MAVRLHKDFKQKNRKSLKRIKGVNTVDISKEVEGTDFINFTRDSKTEIGKKLSYGYPLNPAINTVIGKVGNIRAAMDFLNTVGYPIELVRKSKLTRSDVKKIPNKKHEVKNYWAAVMYFVWERIKQDEEVLNLFKELDDTIKFTCFNEIENDVDGVKSKVIKYNYNMNNYIAILRLLHKIIKSNDSLEDIQKEVNKLILEIKQEPEEGVFSNLPTPVVVDEETLFKID